MLLKDRVDLRIIRRPENILRPGGHQENGQTLRTSRLGLHGLQGESQLGFSRKIQIAQLPVNEIREVPGFARRPMNRARQLLIHLILEGPDAQHIAPLNPTLEPAQNQFVNGVQRHILLAHHRCRSLHHNQITVDRWLQPGFLAPQTPQRHHQQHPDPCNNTQHRFSARGFSLELP